MGMGVFRWISGGLARPYHPVELLAKAVGVFLVVLNLVGCLGDVAGGLPHFGGHLGRFERLAALELGDELLPLIEKAGLVEFGFEDDLEVFVGFVLGDDIFKSGFFSNTFQILLDRLVIVDEILDISIEFIVRILLLNRLLDCSGKKNKHTCTFSGSL